MVRVGPLAERDCTRSGGGDGRARDEMQEDFVLIDEAVMTAGDM
jgi:hypothetical protein